MKNKTRSIIVGVLIILAYSMLTYDITKNTLFGFVFDVVSGLSVIGIAVLLFPLFNTPETWVLNYGYLLCKIGEGVLMIIGGFMILSPELVKIRELIYANIHIYFFTFGAILFYYLLYKTQLVPKFISIWGLIAAIILLVVTLIKLIGITNVILDALVLPMMLNEVFLAVWFIIKGFNK